MGYQATGLWYDTAIWNYFFILEFIVWNMTTNYARKLSKTYPIVFTRVSTRHCVSAPRFASGHATAMSNGPYLLTTSQGRPT